MIRIGEGILIPDEEIKLEFVRSPGPGGQKVNKAATAVQLRFDAAGSSSLSAAIRQRLTRLAGSRMTAEGVLIIRASRHRTQKANRADALRRLAELITRAARPPAKRTPTQPTAAARQRRLQAKRLRSRIKALRDQPEE